MILPMDQEVHNLALLKPVCQRSLRDHWRNSRKVPAVIGLTRSIWLICFVQFILGDPAFPIQPNKRDKLNKPNNDLLLCRWTIILVELSRISLLA
jgi:hypothetical protein